MIILSGYNDFYEGWIHAHFAEWPTDIHGRLLYKSVAWAEGFNTARETPPNIRWLALIKEIELGHIRVANRTMIDEDRKMSKKIKKDGGTTEGVTI